MIHESNHIVILSFHRRPRIAQLRKSFSCNNLTSFASQRMNQHQDRIRRQENVTANLLLGMQPVNTTIDLCGILDGALCPPPTYNFVSSTIITLSSSIDIADHLPAIACRSRTPKHSLSLRSAAWRLKGPCAINFIKWMRDSSAVDDGRNRLCIFPFRNVLPRPVPGGTCSFPISRYDQSVPVHCDQRTV